MASSIGVLDHLGKPHREFHALAYLFGAGAVGGRRFPQPFNACEQRLEALLKQLLAKSRVGARPCQIGIGDRREGAHRCACSWGPNLANLAPYSHSKGPRLSFYYTAMRS